uniref:Uncharacterized protein n=1 Tax=Rhizophora mucronata TaxID=61149 RepID=A0A2P2KFK7_RHIMU
MIASVHNILNCKTIRELTSRKTKSVTIIMFPVKISVHRKTMRRAATPVFPATKNAMQKDSRWGVWY